MVEHANHTFHERFRASADELCDAGLNRFRVFVMREVTERPATDSPGASS